MALRVRIMEWLSVRKRREDLPALRELVGPSPDVRILDVGGGAGSATAAYASGAGEVVVLEPDDAKVALGRARRPGIRFERGRAESMPFPDGSFDRVVAIVAFHHVEDPGAALREIRRVLRPGGRLVLHELEPGHAPGRLAGVLFGAGHDPHMHFYEPEELRAAVEAQGFRDVVMRAGVRGYFVVGTA